MLNQSCFEHHSILSNTIDVIKRLSMYSNEMHNSLNDILGNKDITKKEKKIINELMQYLKDLNIFFSKFSDIDNTQFEYKPFIDFLFDKRNPTQAVKSAIKAKNCIQQLV